jgi:hypothetical protein
LSHFTGPVMGVCFPMMGHVRVEVHDGAAAVVVLVTTVVP